MWKLFEAADKAFENTTGRRWSCTVAAVPKAKRRAIPGDRLRESRKAKRLQMLTSESGQKR